MAALCYGFTAYVPAAIVARASGNMSARVCSARLGLLWRMRFCLRRSARRG